MVQRKKGSKAFTIIELLVVVAILAIIAVIAIPRFIGAIEKSEDARHLADINTVYKAVQMYYMDNAKYPTIQGNQEGTTQPQPEFGTPHNIDFSELDGDYLMKLPHFSYWLIDYKGRVYHAKYKLATKDGANLDLDGKYKYYKRNLDNESYKEQVSGSVTLSSREYLEIYDEKGRQLPELTNKFMGVVEHPEAVNGPPEEGNPTPLTGVKQISLGNDHALALMQDGTVLSWGNNKYGQLGYNTNVGTTTCVYTPTIIPGLTGVKYVSAGLSFSSAIMSDGTVKSWGYNKFGQLGTGVGIGTENAYPTPTTVPGVQGATTLSSGFYYTLALMNNGTVMGWGDSYEGELGIAQHNVAPLTISGLTGVRQAEAGASHSLFLMEDGTVRSCGYNYNRQLGYLTPFQETQPHPNITEIPGLTNIKVIEAGNCDGAAIDKNGTLITWGHNHDGQLVRTEGMGMNGNCLPRAISSLPAITQIKMDNSATIIRTVDGKVATYGNNYYGRKGDTTGGGSSGSDLLPDYVKGMSNVAQVEVGGTIAVAILDNGDVMTWGSNIYGLMGIPTGIGANTKIITPTLLEGLN